MVGGALYAGVDVGGTKIRAAIATDQGAVLREVEAPTDPAGGIAIVERIAGLVLEVAGIDMPRVIGLGMASPGAVDPVTGRTRFSQNIDGLDVVDLPGELSARLDLPVAVGNDVDLAAVAERWVGHARGCDDLAVVSVGTGIGAGLISGGRLVRGHRGAGGEIAELPLVGDPTDPEQRRAGVFESQVGTPGFVRRYLAAGGSEVTGGREILRTADDGDELARQVTRSLAHDVALGICAVVALLDPELVVLAGGVGAHPRFADEVTLVLTELLDDPPRTIVSALGDRASLVGALARAVEAADGSR